MQNAARIAIIGGGIGGLAAASALLRQGFDVQLYERSADLRELGAGMQMGPNAVKALEALDLGDALDRVACEPVNMVGLTWNNASLRHRLPLGSAAPALYGARYLTVHRADLLELLRATVPPERLHLRAVCVGVAHLGDRAMAQFADGNNIHADIIIGADGIHSTVRQALFGQDQPRFTGLMCWRGIVPIELVAQRLGPDGSVALGRDEFVHWLGPDGEVVCYPIRSGRWYNIVAGKLAPNWLDDSWSVPSTREELLAAFAGWNPALLTMFAAIEHPYKWGLHDRDPLEHWTRGRISLLGDAAHPMLPTLAQGGAITIEDGYALARNLAAHRDDLPAGLQAYEAERRPRASRVQLMARTQFENNKLTPPPPPLDRSWIFSHDVTRYVAPDQQAPASSDPATIENARHES